MGSNKKEEKKVIGKTCELSGDEETVRYVINHLVFCPMTQFVFWLYSLGIIYWSSWKGGKKSENVKSSAHQAK